MENNLVVQSNELVLAAYTMTTKEKQLILACVSQIDSRLDAPEVDKQTKFMVTADDIKMLFYRDSDAPNLYRDLEQASNRLYERDVFIDLDDDMTLKTRFVSSIVFDPKRDRVEICFAEKILPYLTQLSAKFTKYRLIEISELKSMHAIRLYELIVCWIGQYQYSVSYDLDNFRYVMGAEGKYKQFGQLKQYVIDKAIEEINMNTDYTVSVQYVKKRRGKGYEGLKLNFHKKKLNKLADKSGVLSESAIQSIVDSVQFMNDYNDHPSLSYDGKMNTHTFKHEMISIIHREPESFNKTNKSLESYLAKIKQGK